MIEIEFSPSITGCYAILKMGFSQLLTELEDVVSFGIYIVKALVVRTCQGQTPHVQRPRALANFWTYATSMCCMKKLYAFEFRALLRTLIWGQYVSVESLWFEYKMAAPSRWLIIFIPFCQFACKLKIFNCAETMWRRWLKPWKGTFAPRLGLVEKYSCMSVYWFNWWARW